MKNAFAAWMWSLGVIARSYRTVVILAALTALWAFAGYEWLGLAESSALLLIIAVVWAIVQMVAGIVIVGGTVSSAAEAAEMDARSVGLNSIWTRGWKKIVTTLIFCLVSLALVWVSSTIFNWINGHSVEVASFLTWHSQKPVSHILIEKIYHVIEVLIWTILGGFLLSFFIALVRDGWRAATRQTGKLLAGCAFRTPLLTSLLSAAVFGGIVYKLINWHPTVPAGFWDYTQMIVRFSLALVFLSAGVLFWSLALARLQAHKQDAA